MKANSYAPMTGGAGATEDARGTALEISESENLTVSLYKATAEGEVSGEITLPDYIANAEKVLFVKAEPALIDSVTENGETVYDATVTFTVFFITADGDVKSVSFDGETSGKAALGMQETGSGETSTDIELFCEPAGCRLVGPRRISAKCRLTADICVTATARNRPTVTGDHGSLGDMTLQRKSDPESTLCSVCFAEEDIRFSDDIELDGTMPAINEIIRASVRIIPDEVKQTLDGVQMRATALASILYSSADGELVSVQKKLPISEVFDAPEEISAEEGVFCRARARVGTVTAEPAENSFGERKIVELDFVYTADICCMCDRPTILTRDIYSTDYKGEAEYRTVRVCRLGKVMQSNVSVNARESFESSAVQTRAERTEEEGGGGDLATPPRLPRAPIVLFADADIKSLSADFDEQKSRITVTGSAEVYMIVNDEGVLRGITFTTPIKNELDGYGIGGQITARASASCQAVHGRADTSAVYADFEVMMTVTAYSESDEELIDKLMIDKNAPASEPGQAPILVYYPHRGESLWDIAKRYSTTVAALREANHLQGDVSPDDGVMLIPRRRKKGANKKSV